MLSRILVLIRFERKNTMKKMTRKIMAVMLGIFVATPVFASMKFDDNTEIAFKPNGVITIANEGESLEFDEVNKPIFDNKKGEKVVELSGIPSDNNPNRSWAKATFEANCSSPLHVHYKGMEDYYITSEAAHALVTIDDVKHFLKTGDHIRILPNQKHIVTNLSQEKPLFLFVKCVPSWTFEDHNLLEQ